MASTAAGMTAEQWEHAWRCAAPVVVAARRYIRILPEGNRQLSEDAWFELLRAVVQHDADAQKLPATGRSS